MVNFLQENMVIMTKELYKANLQELLFTYVNNMINKMEQVKEIEGVSISVFKYLDEIYQTEKISSSELADKLNVSRPAVSKMVKKLLKKGLVIKSKTEDGRSYTLSLTELSYQIYEKISKVDKQLVEIIDKHLHLHQIDGINNITQALKNEYFNVSGKQP